MDRELGPHPALQHYKAARADGLKIPSTAYNPLLEHLNSAGNLLELKWVFDDLCKYVEKPDIVTYSIVIKAYHHL